MKFQFKKSNKEYFEYYVAAALISEANPQMSSNEIKELLGVDPDDYPRAHKVDLGFWKVSRIIGRVKNYA